MEVYILAEAIQALDKDMETVFASWPNGAVLGPLNRRRHPNHDRYHVIPSRLQLHR